MNKLFRTQPLVFVMLGSLLVGCASTPAVDTTKLPRQIAYPYENLPTSFSFAQEISGPGVTREIVWVYRGQDEGLYRWELYSSHTSPEQPWQIQWYNRNGALVKYSQSNNIAKWSPHNCFRTLGSCEFTYTDPYGFSNDYVRDGVFNGKQWEYKLYRVIEGERELFTNGKVEFNAEGVEIYHEYFTSNNGHQISRYLGPPDKLPNIQ